MSSLNTPSPVGDASSVASLTSNLSMGHQGEIVREANLKKYKTNKKKYFVLRCESVDYPARLEYYDNEKKFKAHQQPKRSISLKACFNINIRTDLKAKWVIALYTKDDCFCIVLDSQEERDSWLSALLALQAGGDDTDGEKPKPTFEHVWKVEVANKGLGATRSINGQYHLCLTGKTVSLVKFLSDGTKDSLEFPLINIRSFGCAQSFFYMEVGRNAVTGTGEIWMEAEDAVIAKEISRAIDAMRSRGDDSGSRQIGRSASVSESTRPISVTSRRHNNSASEKHDEGGSSVPNAVDHAAGYIPNMDSYCDVRQPGRFVTSDHGSSAGRDRSDSLPSSVRASADNHMYSHGPAVSHGHHNHHSHARNMHSHFIPASHRPHSMYTRGISHSPPVIGSSPVSPASGACSTDSAGSSLSIDEGDNWVDVTDGPLNMSRYAANHPVTPESPIEEENCDDYVHWNAPSGLDSGVGDDEKMNNYMPMDRSTAALSLPIQQPHTGSARKYSPGRGNQGAKTGTSPSHSNYMEMNSPCGSSPMDTPGNYMIMSPGNPPDSIRNAAYFNRNVQPHTAPDSANHSRTSSLAEETPDGYMPMMPGQTDDGYVDMEPQAVSVHDDFHHGEMSPSSSCSITSGTPSTDIRFSEYPLEKVNSYLTRSEEEETGSRPTRCYSVGSKPDSLNKKNRIDLINQTDCSRVRAFSVGSRNAPGSKYMSRPLGHDIHATRHALQSGGHFGHHQRHQQGGAGKKSSSAPILSNPLSSSPMNCQNLGGSHSSVEPMDDLMEMDFSPAASTSSKNSRNKNVGKSGGRSKSTSVSDYVCMSPADHDRLSIPGGTSHHSSQSSVASSYSTADGGDVSGHIGSPRPSDHIGLGSPPKSSALRNVYSNAIGRSPPESVARSPPSWSTATPRSSVTRMSSISELKIQKFPTTTPSPPIKPSLLATNSSASSMAHKKAKKPVSSPYVEMNPPHLSSKPVIATSSASKPLTESGPYVEMKGRSSSGCLSAAKPNNIPSSASSEDYLDMSFKPSRRTSVPECKDLNNSNTTDGYVEMGWKPTGESESEKTRKSSLDSQRSTSNNDYMVMSAGPLSNSRNRKERKDSQRRERAQLRSQPINIQQSQQNRKVAIETPPKAPEFLPLGTSLDSQSPLSSPFSSLGRNRNRKSSKDSSSTPTPTGSNSTIFPISLNSPCSPLQPFSEDPSSSDANYVASFDQLEKVPADMSSGTLRLTYPHLEAPKTTVPSIVSTKKDLSKHDYVNFNPGTSSAVPPNPPKITEDDAGDYAMMLPAGISCPNQAETPKKTPNFTNSSVNDTSSKQPEDGILGVNAVSQSTDYSRSSSKPLTVSSLLGMNNLSPSNSNESRNILSSPPSASSKLMSSRQLSSGSSLHEKKLHNFDTDSSCNIATSSDLSALNNLQKEAQENATNEEDAATNTTPTSTHAPPPPLVGCGAPVVYSSPTLSPCPSPSPNPSPCSEGPPTNASPANAVSGGLREKKMSSGSDSSTASRDSQLLVRKYSAGSVSPTGSGGKSKGSGAGEKANSTPVNRRLSCPSKSSISRQVSLSSDISDTSQVEESRISDSGTSWSRQTSSSSASGEVSSSTLALTEKRSLSCSPVPSSASPVPRPAEREINYASLDLRTGSESEDSSTRSPRVLKSQGSVSESQSSTSSPSPNPPGGTFTYAQIDFEKSEELRLASAVKNAKQ